MTINKAIEILNFRSKDFILEQDPELINAIKLGIEALKHIQSKRPYPDLGGIYRLPGETHS